MKTPCAAGRYGSVAGLTSPTCSGLCPKGSYCPEQSVLPTPCRPGVFGGEEGLFTAECSGVCAAGYWCPEASTSSTERTCRPGLLGEGTGLTSAECSKKCTKEDSASATLPCADALCPAGYFCEVSALTPVACGAPHLYCPEGSFEPTVSDEGYYTVRNADHDDPTTRTHQVICPLGHYCTNGVMAECPAGTYGSTEGLSSPACSGQCSPGHYCPPKSTRATMWPCAASFYGADAGLSTASCNGQCAEGYFCPPGSTSATEVSCGGIEVFCPVGSAEPIPVFAGFYTIPEDDNVENRVAQVQCEKRHYCSQGERKQCPPGTFGGEVGLQKEACSGLCTPGYFCPAGSLSDTETPCPPGTYGETYGLTDAACSGPCLGHFECPEASTLPTVLYKNMNR